MHISHNLGPAQWILMNRWFDKYLKGEEFEIPRTAASELIVHSESETAKFVVTPDKADQLVALAIYYSHDPNPKSRFWISAEAEENGGVWTASLPIREDLPLYAFANCSYPLDEPVVAFQGTASNFTITSAIGAHSPKTIKPERLFEEAVDQSVFSDLEKSGLRDWGVSSRSGITTFKFRDPRSATPSPDTVMKVTVKVPRERMSYRFRVTKNKYIADSKDPQTTWFASRQMTKMARQEILLKASDFMDREKIEMDDWSNIATFTFEIYDGAAKESLQFSNKANHGLISKIEWVK